MIAVGKIEHPEHRQLVESSIRLASDGRVQSSLTQLRLAFGIQV